MKPFNVLDRNLDIHQHYLLEASAGTGKTFSIQNIVVRLLLEEPCVPLNTILVVTFTRAATRDLYQRIRNNIDSCLDFINQRLNTGIISDEAPDYLCALMEKEDKIVMQAKRHLQQALFTFDQASIFSIHGFCSRMLRQHAIESDSGFHASEGLEALPNTELRQIIRDFFRTEMRTPFYSPAQLAIILKKDPKQNKLLKALKSGHDFAPQSGYLEHLQDFNAAFYRLKMDMQLSYENMMADFDKQIPLFKQSKELSNEQRPFWAHRFASLFTRDAINQEDFDWLISDGILWNKFFDLKLLKAGKNIPEDLHYPHFNQALTEILEPSVLKAGDFNLLLARIAHDCSRLLRRYQREEERISPDDLLGRMLQALQHSSFAHQVRHAYHAAIIDEFQDTDPIQWKLFKQLFISDHTWNGYLYLVGDPKQSIYSFRQADIYTYLAAAETLGKDHCFTLNVNYRSQPHLVHALNTLFNSSLVPQLMTLPKRGTTLPYLPVTAADRNEVYEDEKKAIHFCFADCSSQKKAKLEDIETKVLFPFIVQEMRRLHKEKQFTDSQFAVLVRDRYQAERLIHFFESVHIPYINQRGMSLADSAALQCLIDLIQAVLLPQDRGALKIALGSTLLGWTNDELLNLDTAIGSYDSVYYLLQKLRCSLTEKGFAPFFEELLLSQWKADELSVQERLLNQKEGLQFYHDLQQIADIIIEHHFNGWNTPEGLIAFMDSFDEWADDENALLMRMQDPNKEGVKIITLHSSKGLEFDVVFALGLIPKTIISTGLIPLETHGKIVQTPLETTDSRFLSYCEEIDAEKMRQLYVALTRAKYQLYIPAILGRSTLIASGEASPLDLWMGRFNQPDANYTALYQRINDNVERELLNFLEKHGKEHHLSYSIHQEIILEPIQVNNKIFTPLISPPLVEVGGEITMVSSFTSLSRHLGLRKEIGDVIAPHDFDVFNKTIHLMPASSETGIFLHSLLEKIRFSDWKNLAQTHDGINLIQPFIKNTPFEPWGLVLADLIYSLLNTTLFSQDSSFCLADLQANQIYREMPFLFPSTNVSLLNANGLIKGIIDLIFIYDGKYYIVDWKSNWLGTHNDAYQQPHLQAAMEENCYFLQIQIYTEALRRYLLLVDERPFKKCFGGTIYLFVRGVSPDSQTGIYHHSPLLCEDLCFDPA